MVLIVPYEPPRDFAPVWRCPFCRVVDVKARGALLFSSNLRKLRNPPVLDLQGAHPEMTAISGSAAAVTGAASGIGRALALELAARGCDLALADRDEAGLQQVAAEIGKAGTRKVSTHRVDVGEPAQIQEFAQAAIAAHPGLNIVINNAGVALLGSFNEVDQAQMEWLININFWGVVHGTRAFLPHLSKQREAHIIDLGIGKSPPRILIGNDAWFMDLLQRFRPATYWAALAKRIEKMGAQAGK